MNGHLIDKKYDAVHLKEQEMIVQSHQTKKAEKQK